MTKLLKTSGVKRFFLFIVVFLIVTDLAVLLDIPVLRQVLAFLFLTVLPGLLILLILKLNKIGLLEKVVLSVGLSVAFLMLFGLVVNSLLLATGYVRPLSTVPLLTSFSIAIVILSIAAYLRNKHAIFSSINLKLNTAEKALLIVPALFPLLSIWGTRLMNVTDNNLCLMFLLFLIPAYVIFVSFFNRQVSERVYPFAIFLTSISLLLMFSLRSNHLIGADTHLEYYYFQTTFSNSHWSILESGLLDACLSISLLPSIYQSFLDINPEYLFKVLYSLLVAILPLVTYILSRKYIGSFYAFLTSIFVMSQIIFLWTPAEARTNTAILFFALAIMVLFHDGIGEFNKRALFIIFMVSTILTHYSTSYVFFLILLLTWIVMEILSGIALRRKKAVALSQNPVAGQDPEPTALEGKPSSGSDDRVHRDATVESPWRKRSITIVAVSLFFVFLFLWYSQITETPFRIGVRVIGRTFTNFYEFFLLESRGEIAQAALGKDIIYKGVPEKVEFVFSWMTILLIAIGVFALIRRFKGMWSTLGSGCAKSGLLPGKFKAEHLTLLVVCCAILLFSLVLPSISRSYGGIRTYFQMMAPLSVVFGIGGITVSKYLRSQPQWVLLAVLIPYLMCTTGTMYQICGSPKAITLNSEGWHYGGAYISDQESYGARWLRDKAGENTKTYAFPRSRNMLISQAGIRRPDTDSLLEPDGKVNGYIYLRYYDVVGGKVLDKYGSYDIAEYQDKFMGKNKIYSNGGTEVWR